MNSEALLEHYARIADAPDAITRLRQFVSDLAVRGKLVEHDAADEPAAHSLKRLEKAVAKACLQEGLRARAPVAKLARDDLWFDIPQSWILTAFDDIFVIVSGVTKGQKITAAEAADVPYLRVANVQRGHLDLSVIKQITVRRADRDRYALRSGDVLMTEGGDWDKLGRAAIWRNEVPDCIHQNHIFRVRPPSSDVLPEWVTVYVNSLLGRAFFENASKQTTNLASINMTQLRACPIPLPPLAEQHRIVAKVDELMALCDRLEAARAEREAARDRLAAASLARLNAPDPDPATFTTHARFALANLALLTTRQDQIKQLRQTILNLAVQGKLVDQNVADEDAAKLLKRLSAERARLVKAGSIPRPKDCERDTDFLAAQLPASWLPIALGDVCNLVTSGSRGWAEFYADTGPGFVRAQNIRFGKLKLDELACVNPRTKSEGARTQVAEGDLLIVITGAGVTNPALLDRDLGEAYVSQHVGLVRPSDRQLSPWLLLCLMANAGGRSELMMRAYGAGKPGLNLDNIRSLSVPLPPLAEQHRIVAKVDELMALCDRLEASLATADDTRRRLLEALLHEALTAQPVHALELA